MPRAGCAAFGVPCASHHLRPGHARDGLLAAARPGCAGAAAAIAAATILAPISVLGALLRRRRHLRHLRHLRRPRRRLYHPRHAACRRRRPRHAGGAATSAAGGGWLWQRSHGVHVGAPALRHGLLAPELVVVADADEVLCGSASDGPGGHGVPVRPAGVDASADAALGERSGLCRCVWRRPGLPWRVRAIAARAGCCPGPRPWCVALHRPRRRRRWLRLRSRGAAPRAIVAAPALAVEFPRGGRGIARRCRGCLKIAILPSARSWSEAGPALPPLAEPRRHRLPRRRRPRWRRQGGRLRGRQPVSQRTDPHDGLCSGGAEPSAAAGAEKRGDHGLLTSRLPADMPL
mmetsp:Transcript_681/g.1793  ORF Transcript_681/g.1793 Transcript_681/m.1793 type:complete len:347 (+) Transcript_681:303-1343(+)